MLRLSGYYSSTSLSALVLGAMLSSPAFCAPDGGVVTHGQADIFAPAEGHVVINQHTDKAVINWNNFDNNAGEHTEFRQPSRNAATLNRIGGTAPTNIDGKLTANGNVVVVNPNGIVFGRNAKVDVGGLVASTADIADENFMKGTLGFDRLGKPDAAIINHGSITAKDAGLVGLVAPNVENHGVITANLGRVQLASGDTATVDLHGDGLIEIAVTDKVQSQLVVNTGSIKAEGGTIALTAAAGGDIVNSLIHAEGELLAPSIQQQNGKIIIAAEGRNAVADNNAEAKNIKDGNSFISTANILMDVSGRESGARGGSIAITGDQIAIGAGTLMDVSGSAPAPVLKPIKQAAVETSSLTAVKQVKNEADFLASEHRGGGSIKIGGDYLGTGNTPAAENVYVDANTLIANEGLEHGDGGRTIVWADHNTAFYGNVFGRGGEATGHGGFLETSGKNMLDAQGYADLTASDGYQRGTYLLDPTNITIYGNVDPTFVSTDASINLNTGLQLWLDASDASKVQLTYSTNGVATTIVGNTSGTNTLNTAADVSANLKVGARIRLGSAGAVTTADTQGADTYTITNISGTTITVAETVTSDYSGQNIYRGLVSEWRDKTTNNNNASRADASRQPLWLDNQLNNNDVFFYNGNQGLTIPYNAAINPSTGSIRVISQFDGTFGPYYSPLSARSTGPAPTFNPLRGYNFYVSNSNNIEVWNGDGASNWLKINAGAATTNPEILEEFYNSSNVTFYRNGTNYGSNIGTADNQIVSTTVGALGGSTFASWVGYVPEVLIYNAALSTARQHLLDQYQSAKWGVELSGVGTGATENIRATAADGYSVFSTRYLERLSQTADVSLLADDNITLDLKGDTLNLANNRSLSLKTTNQDIKSVSSGNIRTNGTGNITLDAGRDVLLTHDIDLIAQGTGNISLKAKNDIDLNTVTLTSNGGNITLHSDSDSSQAGAVDISNTTINTNNGNLTVGGGADPANNYAYGTTVSGNRGIRIINSTVNSGSGNISLKAHNNINIATDGNRAVTIGDSNLDFSGNSQFSADARSIGTAGRIFQNGVEVYNSNIRGADNASVAISGYGGIGVRNTEGIVSTNTNITTNNGNITLTGIAEDASFRSDPGMRITSTNIASSGSGTVTINATSGNSANQNHGFDMNNASTVTGGSGDVIFNLQQDATAADTAGIDTDDNSANRIGSASMTGNIIFNSDSVQFGNDADLNINTQGNVSFIPRTTGTAINLGNATGGLDLTQAELSTIKSANTIIAGDGTNTSTITVSDNIDMSATAANFSILGNNVALNNSLKINAANTLNVTADSGNITHTAGTLTANRINLDATGTIAADVTATNVDIANNSTATTLTGTVAGGQTQTEANLITGGPGNDANYTFEGFTIRKVAAAGSGGGGSAAPTPAPAPQPQTPVVDNQPPQTQQPTPLPQPESPAPVAPVAPVAPPKVDVPTTVEIVSQNPPMSGNGIVTTEKAQVTSNDKRNNEQIIYIEDEGTNVQNVKGKVSIKKELAKMLGLDNLNLFK